MALSGVGSPMAFAIAPAPATAIRPGVAAQARTRPPILRRCGLLAASQP